MRAHAASLAVVLLGLLAVSDAVRAADQPIDAAKLKLKAGGSRSGPVLTFVSRDPGALFPPIGSADDPATGAPGGAVIELFSQSGQASLSVPPGAGNPGWSARPAAHPSYRFRNKFAPMGIATLRTATLRQGKLLKLVARDTGLALTSLQGPIGIRITMGTLRSCALFDVATIVTDKPGLYLAKHALAASISDCSDASLGGALPPPTCGGIFPKCFGTCPGDGVCSLGFYACACISPSAPCGQTFSVCNGECAAGEQCVAVWGGPAPSCECIPVGSTRCGSPGAPECGGECSSGKECRPAYAFPMLGGGLGCGCGTPGPCGPDSRYLGSLECPNGFACAVDASLTFSCKPIPCSGGSGYPTCDGTCGPGGVCQAVTTPDFGSICVCGVTTLGSCGTPGDTGNELGVGHYCNTPDDCTGLSANVCAFAFDSSLPHVCIVGPCDGATNCGSNASCVCNTLGCGCFPNACL
jgi:hypothetical protein